MIESTKPAFENVTRKSTRRLLDLHSRTTPVMKSALRYSDIIATMANDDHWEGIQTVTLSPGFLLEAIQEPSPVESISIT
jgi:hypothetical protein